MRTPYLAVGFLLLAAGALGFFQKPLLGIFEVNTVHNLVHLGSGALTLWAALQGIGAMRSWGKIFGVVYLIVAIAGWALGGDLPGLMHVNQADNVLHLLLAGFFLYFGLLAPPRL